MAAWRWRENLRPKDALLGRGQEASGEPIFEPSHDLSLLLLLGLVLAVRDETHLDEGQNFDDSPFPGLKRFRFLKLKQIKFLR